MKHIAKKLTDQLGLAKTVATKKVIKQFAHAFEFVYFGAVDPEDEDQILVRGVTLSPRRRDFHYSVGTFRGYDMVLVERHATLHVPNRPERDYRWLILQIDLHKRHDLPKLFIDGHRHDDTFYANLSAAFAHFANVSHLFAAQDTLFAKHFKVFAHASAYGEVVATLRPEITAMLAHHFHQFDYEFDTDKVLIYASQSAITQHTLREMMRVGLWLAQQLDASQESGE